MPRGVYQRIKGTRKNKSLLDAQEAQVLSWYDQGLTQVEIAKLAGCCQANLSKWLSKRGLISPNVNHRWLKELTPRQQSIIHGTLLGDGYMRVVATGGINAHLQLKHSIKQRNWLEWKYNELRNLFVMEPRVVFDEGGFKGKYEGQVYEKVYVTSKCHPLLTEIHDEFYTRSNSEVTEHIHKKRVTQTILDKVDDVALMVWFCDDGGGDANRSYMCLGGMSELEYDLIQNWFWCQAMPGNLVKLEGNCYNLNLTHVGTVQLHSRISKHVPLCMAHKLKGL